MSQTPEQLFDETLYNLLPDLNPEGPLEEMFAAKIARYTVLTDMATLHLLRLDPANPEQAKDHRRAAALLANYERTLKFAYAELRRLQAERALAQPAQSPTRLARTVLLTKPDGAPRKSPAPQPAPNAAAPTAPHTQPQPARAA
jgi:hypothetical protein